MNLEDYISVERLQVYVDVLKLKPEEALAGYNWNKTLSSAMQPVMHCLEVTLRNSIDYCIRHNPPPGAKDIYRTDKNWIFDLPRHMGDKEFIRQNKRYKLDSQGQIKYLPNGSPVYNFTTWEEKAIRKVSARITKAGKTITAERVISGLDLGFWTNLLCKGYEEPRTLSILWPNLLPHVFPGAPKGTKRHIIERKLNQIRELRNRLSHHEAIWKFQYEDSNGNPDYNQPVYGLNASLALLNKAYNNMLEVLSWISPDRYAAFLTEGHHLRFRTLCSLDGLHSFTRPTKIHNSLNVRQSPEVKVILKRMDRQKTLRLMDRKTIIAVIGADFIRY
ncbi:hypothetical protein YKD1_07980 [Yersinia pseudotuberculosis]|uniref:CAAX protease n=1 Tax=Yersinia pseudotuberculosis TaxID=633 RepID=UPI0038B4FA32